MINARETQSAPRVLVVEDDPDIAASLEFTFRREGFSVHIAPNGEDAIAQLERGAVDLVLLDLMLPDMPGLEVLKRLRRSQHLTHTRVIVVTAKKDEVDRILGFELGADDYVNKPFSPRELVLRARAVLQRAAATAESSPDDTKHLSAGPIDIDMEFHRAHVAGEPLQLTLTEFRLLAELVRAGGRVRSREALLAEVWRYDSEVMSRTVDTHVRRLRGKLGAASGWLHTVRGIGYRIQSPEKDS